MWLSFVALACLFAAPALAADDYPILTPPSGPGPRINGPRAYGARPGRPFLYRIPCTGERPIRFSARGLPAGLQLEPETGIIRGTTPGQPGRHVVTIEARNRRGKASREFQIVIGDTLSLTPQMGWNNWYTHYAQVTGTVIRDAADAMISSGMADFGYEYRLHRRLLRPAAEIRRTRATAVSLATLPARSSPTPIFRT